MNNQQPQSASQSEGPSAGTTNSIAKPGSIHYTQIIPKVKSYLKAAAEADPTDPSFDHEVNLYTLADSANEVNVKLGKIEEVYDMQKQLRMACMDMMVDQEMAKMDEKERAKVGRKLHDAAKSEKDRFEWAIMTAYLAQMALREGMELIIEEL